MTLAQKDFDEIKNLVRSTVKEEINLLPTKDEFFGKMDEVMGELKTIREEQTVQSHQLLNHEDRITTLEEVEKVGIQTP